MSKIKGGAQVIRQNFSMHPNLLKVFIDIANKLNSERAELIVSNRSQRVTYSKVVAALAYHVKETLLGPDNDLTDMMRRLMTDYEGSAYELTDVPVEVIERRARRSRRIPDNAALPVPALDLESSDLKPSNLTSFDAKPFDVKPFELEAIEDDDEA